MIVVVYSADTVPSIFIHLKVYVFRHTSMHRTFSSNLLLRQHGTNRWTPIPRHRKRSNDVYFTTYMEQTLHCSWHSSLASLFSRLPSLYLILASYLGDGLISLDNTLQPITEDVSFTSPQVSQSACRHDIQRHSEIVGGLYILFSPLFSANVLFLWCVGCLLLSLLHSDENMTEHSTDTAIQEFCNIWGPWTKIALTCHGHITVPTQQDCCITPSTCF